ncbi:MAG: DUF3592 domain-containing protein [Myxococcota bacterium]
MQLAIPSAPRPVTLRQIPGALRRVALIGGGAVLLTLVAWLVVARLQAPLAEQRRFLERAVPVTGQVAEVELPPMDSRLDSPAKLRVVFQLEGRDFASSSVPMDGVEAERHFQGSKVKLLVDPATPSKAQEERWARAQAGWVWLGTLVLGVGLLLVVGVVAFELRRAIRREIAPLRVGALVWLTPDEALPDTRDELRFKAHYFRDDRRLEVTALVRPGRRPVRNGEKVLAAVLPAEPTWARVVDEELATTLGWYR